MSVYDGNGIFTKEEHDYILNEYVSLEEAGVKKSKICLQIYQKLWKLYPNLVCSLDDVKIEVKWYMKIIVQIRNNRAVNTKNEAKGENIDNVAETVVSKVIQLLPDDPRNNRALRPATIIAKEEGNWSDEEELAEAMEDEIVEILPSNSGLAHNYGFCPLNKDDSSDKLEARSKAFDSVVNWIQNKLGAFQDHDDLMDRISAFQNKTILNWSTMIEQRLKTASSYSLLKNTENWSILLPKYVLMVTPDCQLLPLPVVSFGMNITDSSRLCNLLGTKLTSDLKTSKYQPICVTLSLDSGGSLQDILKNLVWTLLHHCFNYKIGDFLKVDSHSFSKNSLPEKYRIILDDRPLELLQTWFIESFYTKFITTNLPLFILFIPIQSHHQSSLITDFFLLIASHSNIIPLFPIVCEGVDGFKRAVRTVAYKKFQVEHFEISNPSNYRASQYLLDLLRFDSDFPLKFSATFLSYLSHTFDSSLSLEPMLTPLCIGLLNHFSSVYLSDRIISGLYSSDAYFNESETRYLQDKLSLSNEVSSKSSVDQLKAHKKYFGFFIFVVASILDTIQTSPHFPPIPLKLSEYELTALYKTAALKDTDILSVPYSKMFTSENGLRFLWHSISNSKVGNKSAVLWESKLSTILSAIRTLSSTELATRVKNWITDFANPFDKKDLSVGILSFIKNPSQDRPIHVFISNLIRESSGFCNQAIFSLKQNFESALNSGESAVAPASIVNLNNMSAIKRRKVQMEVAFASSNHQCSSSIYAVFESLIRSNLIVPPVLAELIDVDFMHQESYPMNALIHPFLYLSTCSSVDETTTVASKPKRGVRKLTCPSDWEDICIAFKVCPSSSKFSLASWADSFRTIVIESAVDQTDEIIAARFEQSVDELQFLGLIQMNRSKSIVTRKSYQF